MNAPAVLPPDEDKTLLPLVTHAVFTPIALLVVTFRLVARWKGNGFKLDDYFMMAALVCAMTNFPFTVVGSQHGVGRHAYYLDLADVIVAVKTLIVGEFFLLVGLMFVKISVLLFLLNISGTTRWLRWVLRANLVLIFSSTFAFCFVIWFQCTPVQGNWDPTVPGRKCIELKKFMDATYVLSAITVFTDFLCALMPLPIIWKLKLNTKTKIGIMSVIALGLLAAASSIVRIVLVKDFKNSRVDPTFALLYVGVWTLIELHIAIIVASLPPCRALFLRIVSNLHGKTFQDSKYDSNGEPSKNGKGGVTGIELKRSVLVTSERAQGGNDGGYLRMDDNFRVPSEDHRQLPRSIV